MLGVVLVVRNRAVRQDSAKHQDILETLGANKGARSHWLARNSVLV
jgi:hypothetical protein